MFWNGGKWWELHSIIGFMQLVIKANQCRWGWNGTLSCIVVGGGINQIDNFFFVVSIRFIKACRPKKKRISCSSTKMWIYRWAFKVHTNMAFYFFFSDSAYFQSRFWCGWHRCFDFVFCHAWIFLTTSFFFFHVQFDIFFVCVDAQDVFLYPKMDRFLVQNKRAWWETIGKSNIGSKKKKKIYADLDRFFFSFM